MFLDGETLYVADTENHAIRAVDSERRQRLHDRGHRQPGARASSGPASSGPAKTTAALQPLGRDPDPRRQGPLHRHGRPAPDLEARPRLPAWSASSPGRDTRTSSTAQPRTANFAQPSGLATDGENLFVADSEVSGVRVITGIQGERRPVVRTIVGEGLFEFGDQDGRGGDRPAPALPGTGLRRRPPLHRRYLQQQDQGLRAQEPRSVKTLRRHAQGRRQRRSASLLRARRLERSRYQALRRRHQQPQDQGRRPEDRGGQDAAPRRSDAAAPGRRARRSFPTRRRSTPPASRSRPESRSRSRSRSRCPRAIKLNEESPLAYLVETPDKKGILVGRMCRRKARRSSPRPRVQDRPSRWPRRPRPAKSSTCALAPDLRLQRAVEPLPDPQLIWNVPITFGDSAPAGAINLTTDGK